MFYTNSGFVTLPFKVQVWIRFCDCVIAAQSMIIITISVSEIERHNAGRDCDECFAALLPLETIVCRAIVPYC